MIYTCYEMIRDCRAGRAEGWSYFAAHYVPVVQRLLVHYFPEQASDSELIESTLLALRDNDAGLFQSLGPAPERAFVSELRQHVLRAVAAVRPSGAPGADIDLETLGRALEPLTLTEKQAVWFETMRYGDADTGRMLRMSPQTVAKVRERANELVRGAVDAWRSSLLADNGPLLGRAAAAESIAECLPARSFSDVIDGRATWSAREEMERHAKGCWHCVDHFCRLLEAADVLRACAS